MGSGASANVNQVEASNINAAFARDVMGEMFTSDHEKRLLFYEEYRERRSNRARSEGTLSGPVCSPFPAAATTAATTATAWSCLNVV